MKTIAHTIAALAAGLVAAATTSAQTPLPKNFVGAPLSGANESPAVPTCAGGAAIVHLRDGVLTYKLNVEGLDDIVAAHLHFGKPGENGPILVTLFELPPPDEAARADDDDDVDQVDDQTLAAGTITDDDVDSPPGVTFADGTPFDGTADGLLRLLREQSIYVNVHTVANPEGEIRAQMRIAGPGAGGPNPNKGNGSLCDESDCDDDDDDNSDAARLRADLNNDGVVNDADLRILLNNFTKVAKDNSADTDDNPPVRTRRRMIPVGR